jgi:hypothetical protein
MRGISKLAEETFASQEELSFMELVSSCKTMSNIEMTDPLTNICLSSILMIMKPDRLNIFLGISTTTYFRDILTHILLMWRIW